ncbi:hypothetical protein B481_1060 [Planococcus halocryophilus Or1]|nr:hypothetical protein B481_1060 [Planococcus halocryophilus Or1]
MKKIGFAIMSLMLVASFTVSAAPMPTDAAAVKVKPMKTVQPSTKSTKAVLLALQK